MLLDRIAAPPSVAAAAIAKIVLVNIVFPSDLLLALCPHNPRHDPGRWCCASRGTRARRQPREGRREHARLSSREARGFETTTVGRPPGCIGRDCTKGQGSGV